jgi:hypothetical protein
LSDDLLDNLAAGFFTLGFYNIVIDLLDLKPTVAVGVGDLIVAVVLVFLLVRKDSNE